MIKSMIKTINNALYEKEMTFDCARELLKSLRMITGKEYSIIRCRVVYKDELDGQFHDAWVNA